MHARPQEISSRFKELQDKRRRERARMASKWSEYHMKTSNGVALKDAKTKVIFLLFMYVYVYVCVCVCMCVRARVRVCVYTSTKYNEI